MDLLSVDASKLVDSSYWHAFVEADQYARFVDGDAHQIELHGLLHPPIFEGFASVTVMAANLRHTMMYYHFINAGCSFQPHRRIIGRVRYDRHENAARLRILYLSERCWTGSNEAAARMSQKLLLVRWQRDGWEVGTGQRASELPGLDDGIVGIGGEAEHIARHGYAYVKADAGEQADQDRACEEIGKEADRACRVLHTPAPHRSSASGS